MTEVLLRMLACTYFIHQHANTILDTIRYCTIVFDPLSLIGPFFDPYGQNYTLGLVKNNKFVFIKIPISALILSCKATSKNRFGSLSQLGAVHPPLATKDIYNRVQIPWNFYLSGSTEMLLHYEMFSINMVK